MKQKNEDYENDRKTITLPVVVSNYAKLCMKNRGFNNFSAYIADLIRKDKERQEDLEAMRHAEKGAKPGRATLKSSSSTPIPPDKKGIGYLETTVEDLGDQADEDSVEATLEQIREDQINEANQIDN